jgi:hypothetical protein
MTFFLPSTVFAQGRKNMSRLNFSGYSWFTRSSTEPEGPLENIFGGNSGTVTLNPDKSLTLRILDRGDKRLAAEVWSLKKFGYGTYIFRLRESPAELDKGLVLGLFTYSPDPASNHSEIDLEFSAWGSRSKPVQGQYVMQPYDVPGNMVFFDISRVKGPASYSFTWTPQRVEFLSWLGHGPAPLPNTEGIIHAWLFNDPKGIPLPGSASVHMNLYLVKGAAGTLGQGRREITVDSFEFNSWGLTP